MKTRIISALIGFLLGLILMFSVKQCSTEIVRVPIEIEVEVPVVEVQYDTIYTPKPIPYAVREVDTSLVEQYRKANDSLREALFNKAVTINNYKEVFDDEYQTITVDAETTGTLNFMTLGYKTKPRTIVVDTIVPITIPKDLGLTLYTELGAPTDFSINDKMIFKVGADILTKKNWVFGASYDTNKTAWGKIGIKL
jgi:hypothetical protein